jgi:hypothetical protein
MIPTNRGPLTPEGIIDALNYSCYRHNRDLGVSAESLGRLFNLSGAAMEARYQAEQRRAA